MPKKNALKQLETIELADKLRTVCHKTEDGMANYEFGWDDQKLAESLNLTISNVQGMRLRLIGKTKSETTTITNTHILKRLEALEAWASARPVAPFKAEK